MLKTILFVLLVLIISTTVIGQEQTPEVTPESNERSPRIAFTADVYRGADLEIFVLDLISYEFEIISPSIGFDYNVSFAPDGTQLAFNSTREANAQLGVTDIFIYDFMTETLTNITNQREITDINPQWSYDGQYVLFVSGEISSIYRFDVTSGDIELIIERAANPSWFPDNEGFVFTSGREGTVRIYSLRFDEMEPMVLVEDDNLDMYDPQISPDGMYLAYILSASTDRVVLLNLETGEEQVLTNINFNFGQITWSPDSQCLSYSPYASDNSNVLGNPDGILLYDLRDSTTIELPFEQDGVYGLTWTADATCDDLLAWASAQ